ncbi:hypothetical protein VTJ83DRAFT_6124 [Remersonia thermophila]|uniref:Secreted protein n=1 Tax=Remersonia thermophila TaxID=72144 RepID=A0ABR4D931_9PEZI
MLLKLRLRLPGSIVLLWYIFDVASHLSHPVASCEYQRSGNRLASRRLARSSICFVWLVMLWDPPCAADCFPRRSASFPRTPTLSACSN